MTCLRKTALTAILFTALGGVPAMATNLVASLDTNSGTITVQNIGGGFSPNTIASIHCAGTCPDPVGPLVNPYLNPAVPSAVAVNIPGLGPNQSYAHVLPFWNMLDFSGGGALLITCADRTKVVAETNEADNCQKQAHGNRQPKKVQELKLKKLKLKE